MIISLFVLLSLSAYGESPLKIEYRSPELSYQISKTDKYLALESEPYRFRLAITKCNMEIVDNFWQRIRSNIPDLIMSNAARTTVTIGSQQYRIPLGTRASFLLKGMVEDAMLLYAANSSSCSGARSPASERLATGDDQEKTTVTANLSDSPKVNSLKNCVLTICKSSKDHVPDLDKEAFEVFKLKAQSPASKVFDAEIAPKMQRLAQKFRELQLKSLKKFQDLLSHPPEQISDKDSLAFYQHITGKLRSNLSLVDKEEGGEKRSIFMARKTEPAWDNPVDAVYATFKPNDIEATLEYWNWRQQKFETRSGPDDSTMAYIRASLKQPKASDQAAVKQFAQRIGTRAEILLKNPMFKGESRESLLPLINFSEVDKVSSTGDLPYSDLQRLIYYSARLEGYESFASSPELREKTQNFVGKILSDPKRLALIKADIEQEIDSYQKFLDPYDQSSRCRTSFAVKAVKAPTAEELSKAKIRESSIRKAFNSQILSRFSEPTRRAVGREMKNWKLNYPQTAKQLKNYLVTSAEDKLKWTEKLTPIADPKVMEYLENDLASFCFDQHEGVRPLYDSAYTTAGLIQVSRESTKYPDVGAAVIAHEFGHMLAEQFKTRRSSNKSLEKFKEVRQCLSSKHKGGPDAEMNIAGGRLFESQFAEEDWADLVGQLAQPKMDTNVWCTKFQGEISKDKLNLYDPSDVHSTALFRLLHLEKLKEGELPKECNSALEANGSKVQFSRCL